MSLGSIISEMTEIAFGSIGQRKIIKSKRHFSVAKNKLPKIPTTRTLNHFAGALNFPLNLEKVVETIVAGHTKAVEGEK